jgi:mannose-6-phosphate isomerase-like protein (cupin superfamily)
MTSPHTPDAIVVPPDEGRTIPGPEGLVVKAATEDTGGSVAVLEATSPPGFAAPPHIHHEHDELFYIVEGTFAFVLGDRHVTAPAGSFVFVRRGTMHSPRVVGPEPGRVLTAFVPGGAERAFDDFAALAAEMGDDFDPNGERAQAIARSYASELVDRPA